MPYYDFMKRLFFLLLLLILVSLLYMNWDKIRFFLWEPLNEENLILNRTSKFSDSLPIIISPDEKITTEVFEKNHQAVVNIAATTLTMNFGGQIIPKQDQGRNIKGHSGGKTNMVKNHKINFF